MITDEQRILVSDEYYKSGILKQEIRSYEVSLWTLLDEFITVLKWSDVEQQGRILEPKMTLNVDGTEKFTFSIPMYLYIRDKHVENNNWYNKDIAPIHRIPNPNWDYLNSGNLIVSMRKIKVIFNKATEDEAIFEFLITKVTEEHLNDLLFCRVECEGLAFHELGKIGYKVSLNLDLFMLDYKAWIDSNLTGPEPILNVLYWCEKSGLEKFPSNAFEINPNRWYYQIKMNWNSYLAQGYSTEKVYEEEYVSSWDSELHPLVIASAREKARPVEIENSNIYNITQTIAEQFLIFCRYEYGYDSNYHIISRNVIFYNSYMNEKDIFSFTYPYTTKSINREMDSTELTTKLYVIPLDDSTTLLGTINIMDSPANEMREDYLLNFDYLYMIGAITQEQYDEVAKYKKIMHNYNQELENLSLTLNAYEHRKIDLEAEIKLLNDSITYADLQIKSYDSLYDRIDASDGEVDGYFTRDNATAYSTIIKTDETNQQYITFNTEDRGIAQSTVHLYKNRNTTNLTLTNEITIISFEKDEYGDIIRANFNYTVGVNEDKFVYLTYQYLPKLYYEKVIKAWIAKKDRDEKIVLPPKDAKLIEINTGIETTKVDYNKTLRKKQLAQLQFNEMMGPALREGYWLPEEYSDYGDTKTYTETFPASFVDNRMISNSEDNALYGWDNILFDEENKLYYEVGVLLEKNYYPCIDISNPQLFNWVSSHLSDENHISFIFNNNYYRELEAPEANKLYNLSNFTLDADAKLGFIKDHTTVKPVIILTGIKDMTDDEIKFMLTTGTGKGNPRLGILAPNISSDEIIATITAPLALSIDKFYWDSDKLAGVQNIKSDDVELVYPRIKFSNLGIKLSEDCLNITYESTLLKRYDDYVVTPRTTLRDDMAFPEYFITLKPHVMILANTLTGMLKTNYTLSNAATTVLLDAREVLENNAYPHVAYLMEMNVLNTKYIRILYSLLALIVMINDTDLKFLNVFGYISQIDLDLDAPLNDTIEVKNYKTKFEDLFSTIVALTDEMKRNAADLRAAMNGRIIMGEAAFKETVVQNTSILDAYFDSYFDNSEVVKAKLESIFTEASQILSDSQKSLNKIHDLTLENASILSKFAQNVANELTAKVFNSILMPTQYKVGDIWNKIDSQTGTIIERYVATSSSDDATGGWTRTYDGSLASITGASLKVDAVAGTVDILAQNNINMKSGGNIYIAANENVDIVGNKAVNIGGTLINIGSTTIGNSTVVGGINLVASAYNTVGNNINSNLSKILISPTKIEMGTAELVMKSSSTINMIASTGTAANTSTIKLDANDGIWIGSGKTVSIFSGTDSNSGSSVELNPTHIIMGVASGLNASAFEITSDYLILASGTTSTDFSSKNVTINSTDTNTLTGLKITKNSFGLAVGSGNTRSVILANDEGITVGSGNTPKTSGSYVSISGNGVSIGSLGDLYVNANNFKLLTNHAATSGTLGTTIFAIGTNLNNITSSTNVNTLDSSSTVSFLVNSTGAFINGYVVSNGFVATCTNGIFKANSTSLGFYTANSTPVMTLSGTSMSIASGFTLSVGGPLSITSSGSLDLNTTNLLINSNPSTGLAYFRLGPDKNALLEYTSNGLTINGAITATSFTLANGGTVSGLSTSNINGMELYALKGDIPTSFTVDGVSSQVWNGKTYVGLTQASDNFAGVLIGTTGGDKHFVIPRTALTTAVDISSSGINFDYNETTYIRMGQLGIDINAGHLSINGENVWERGDIIYDFDLPDQHPPHNWIWIKPQSTAGSTGTWSGNFAMNYNGYYPLYYSFTTANSMPMIGSNLGNFTVSVKIKARRSSNALGAVMSGYMNNIQFTYQVGISSSRGNLLCRYDDANHITAISPVSGSVPATTILTALGERQYTAALSPLYDGNDLLVVTVYNENSNLYTVITYIEVTISVSGADTLVPCTVYYFP